MAKHMIQRQKIQKAVGNLDKNEDGAFILLVNDKDGNCSEYLVDDILDSMVGSEVLLSSVEDL